MAEQAFPGCHCVVKEEKGVSRVANLPLHAAQQNMKLRVSVGDVGELQCLVGVAVAVSRAQGASVPQVTLSFEPDRLVVCAQGGLVWAQVTPRALGGEFLVVARTGNVTLQIHALDFLSVLGAYKNLGGAGGAGGELTLRLQYAPGAGAGAGAANVRKKYMLSMGFNRGPTQHNFELPVVMQREAPQLDTPRDIKLTAAFGADFLAFLRRCERYRGFDFATLSIGERGSVGLRMENERKSVELCWRAPVEVLGGDQDHEGYEPVDVRVKPRAWNVASKLLEVSSSVHVVVYGGGCICSLNVNDNPDCLLLYYIPGVMNTGPMEL